MPKDKIKKINNNSENKKKTSKKQENNKKITEQEKLSKKLETYSKKIRNEFKEQSLGVSLLPPFEKLPDDLKEYVLSKSHIKKMETKEEVLEYMKDKIQILITFDDSIIEMKNKNKKPIELKEAILFLEKLKQNNLYKKINPILVTKLEWLNNSYIGDSYITRLISFSNIIYDKGFFQSGIKIAEIHKTMVLKKFEKYIVSYVIMGSFMQGNATEKSDFDVMIVVDDTDVQKMTRYELKDKLLNMIYSLAFQAAELTGTKMNKLHPQVYILTDFWDSIKNANPVIFSMLRDGIAIYDRGLFLPWKQLLKMGKIKPTRESINMFKSYSHALINRVETKLRDYVLEDIYYSILNPMQAALMSYGINPTTPKETIEFAEEFLVNKEKILKKSTLKILYDINVIHKKIEYKEISKITVLKLKEILDNAEIYLKDMDKVFKELDKKRLQEDYYTLFDQLNTNIKNALEFDDIKPKNIKEDFEKNFIENATIKSSYKSILDQIYSLKKKAKDNKITDVEVEFTKKNVSNITKEITNYIGKEKVKILNSKLKKANTKEGIINFCQIDNHIYLKNQDKYYKIKILESKKLDKPTQITLSTFEKNIKTKETKSINFEILFEISNRFKNFELL